MYSMDKPPTPAKYAQPDGQLNKAWKAWFEKFSNSVNNGIDSAAQAASDANASIADISSDSILSPVEKSSIRKEWDAIASEKSVLEAQAISVGVTTEKTTYSNAWQALATYLNGGTTWVSGIPAWISDGSLASNTDIVAATFRNNFKTYYNSRVSLIKKVTDTAATLATWGVNLAGKPADDKLLNALAAQGTNLVPGLRKWANPSPNYVWSDAPWSYDGTALIFPASSPAGYASNSPSFTAYPGNWHTISFTASGSGCELRVDLQPDTLPEQGFNLTATATRYSFTFLLPASWVGVPATFIRFWRQSGTAQIAVYDVQIEIGAEATVYKPCKLDTVGINNQITPANYDSYMQAQSVSAMAYANTYNGTTSSFWTSLYFDSDGQNVLVNIGLNLETRINETAGGHCDVYYELYLNGALVRSRYLAALPNSSDTIAIQIRASDKCYIAVPPSGNVLYEINFIPYFGGTGSAGAIYDGSIEIIGLKR